MILIINILELFLINHGAASLAVVLGQAVPMQTQTPFYSMASSEPLVSNAAVLTHRLLPLAVGIAMIIVQARLPVPSVPTCSGPWDEVEKHRQVFFVALIIDCAALVLLIIQGNLQARRFAVSIPSISVYSACSGRHGQRPTRPEAQACLRGS